MSEILVLYYSAHGATRQMAQMIARGVESVPGASARCGLYRASRRFAKPVEADVPAQGAPYVELADLAECWAGAG